MSGLPPGMGDFGDLITPSLHLGQSADQIMSFLMDQERTVNERIQRLPLNSITQTSLQPPYPHRPASEYGTMPDSGYGPSSGHGRLSTGRRSVYGGSVASASTVARLDIGNIHLDNRSTASYAQSECAVPTTRSVRFQDDQQSSTVQAQLPDYYLGTSLPSFDATDLLSTHGMNDNQSAANGSAVTENFEFVSELKQYRCILCKGPEPRTTKTPSEMTKHIRTHTKPYTCTLPNCNRQFGFQSEHDLNRHIKSCHKDTTTLSDYYMCHHGACKEKKKHWTRWDNLKKHLGDVHQCKNETRDQYLIKNTGLQESDLAGMGVLPAAELAGTSVLSTDIGTELEHIHIAAVKAHPTSSAIWAANSLPISGTGIPGTQSENPIITQFESLQRWGTQEPPRALIDNSRRPTQHPTSSLFLRNAYSQLRSAGIAGTPLRDKAIYTNPSILNAPSRDISHRNFLNIMAAKQRLHEDPWTSESHFASHVDIDNEVGVDAGTEGEDKGVLNGQDDENDDINLEPRHLESLYDSGDGGDHSLFNIEPRADDGNSQEPDHPVEADSYHDGTSADGTTEIVAANGSEKTRAAESTALALANDLPNNLSTDQIQSFLKTLRDNGRLGDLGFELVEKNTSTSAPKRSVRSEQMTVNSSGLTKFPCSHAGCGASFSTNSALRKHEKRHERLFPCTLFCGGQGRNAKTFGSKDDWKRHETRTHFKRRLPGEKWFCRETRTTTECNEPGPCDEAFTSTALFRQHLETIHNHGNDSKSELDTRIERCRAVPIDNRYRWCGFCKGQIPIHQLVPANADIKGAADSDSDSNLASGTEKGHKQNVQHKPNMKGFIFLSDFLAGRYNHIDNHIASRHMPRKSMLDWVADTPDEAGATSGDKRNPQTFDAGSPSKRQDVNNDRQRTKRHLGDHEARTTKRSKSSVTEAVQTGKEIAWFCCCCPNMNSVSLDDRCNQCEHNRCEDCSLEKTVANDI